MTLRHILLHNFYTVMPKMTANIAFECFIFDGVFLKSTFWHLSTSFGHFSTTGGVGYTWAT